MKIKLRILVLCGGPSREKPVSLLGGECVAAACRALGHEAILADISEADLSALDTTVDVIFPVLHGEFGEDGTLQELLDARNLAYVGSGPEASKRAMNKLIAKETWRACGLPTPPWAAFDFIPDSDFALPFDLPAVVKPLSQGSSLGVTFVDTASTLREAIAEGVREWGAVMIEPRVMGRELTVGILGGDPLPLIEVRTPRAFYDFQAKYLDDSTSYVLDTGLGTDLVEDIQRVSLRAFEVLGCRDLGRVDLIFSEEAGSQLLEVNTIPGFTDHSLLPKAAAASGVDMPSLVARLLDMALARSAPR